ncbi:MAG: hypothetical protein D6690_05220 [Nitrospirae bacterium]|nr:MAG: hypothetical protein D6690_05220 [Nitrospirota bacterium]
MSGQQVRDHPGPIKNPLEEFANLLLLGISNRNSHVYGNIVIGTFTDIRITLLYLIFNITYNAAKIIDRTSYHKVLELYVLYIY